MSMQRITLAAISLACSAAGAQAPSIGDFAAAQRTVLEAETRRALARSLEPPANATSTSPAAAVTAVAIPVVPAVGASAPAAVAVPTRAEPPISVRGVAQLRGRRVVEVATDAGSWMLASGDAVPGTTWRVVSVDLAEVRLARPVAKARKPEVRVFALAGAR